MQLTCLLACGVACGVLLLHSARLAKADDVIMPSNDIDSYDDDRAKRPFCNAFTGCGRKRSGPPGPPGPMPFPMARALRSEDPMAALLDLNAEPAVAELSRQILSEAKLWEAIQEARDEVGRRQQQHKLEVSPQRMGGMASMASLRPGSFRRRRAASTASTASLLDSVLERERADRAAAADAADVAAHFE